MNSYGTDDSNSIAITKGSDRYLNITSSGNVGIGLSDPEYKLDVRGPHVRIGDGTSVGIIQYGSNANQSSNFHLGAASGVFRLWNGNIGAGTEILRFNNTGGVSWDGGGNFLDDYERGQFTPSYINATTTNHSRQYGEYIKVGNLVICFIWLRLDGFTANSTAWVEIGGLPFNIPNADIASGGGYIRSAAGFVNYPTGLFGFRNKNVCYLRKEQDAFTYGDMISGANKCDLHATFEYYV